MHTPPRCECGATMIHGNMAIATPNGRYSCWPCSQVKRELLSACKAALAFVDHHDNNSPEEVRICQQLKAAILKGEG